MFNNDRSLDAPLLEVVAGILNLAAPHFHHLYLSLFPTLRVSTFPYLPLIVASLVVMSEI
jgi:hypothetical protein